VLPNNEVASTTIKKYNDQGELVGYAEYDGDFKHHTNPDEKYDILTSKEQITKERLTNLIKLSYNFY
jgi:hypothetical protein